MINRYFHYKADKAYRVFSYVIFQTEEHKNIQYTDSSYDYTLTESVLLFLCLKTLHSPSKSLDKANVMSFDNFSALFRFIIYSIQNQFK